MKLANFNYKKKISCIGKCSSYGKINAAIILSLLSIVMMVGPLGLINSVNAQANTSTQNGVIGNNVTMDMQQSSQVNTTQQQLPTISKPDAQFFVLAEDLFEIRDNLAEAREALNRGNFLELSQHIDNIDHLITVLINPLPANSTGFEQRGELMQQQPTINNTANGQTPTMG